MKTHRVPTKKKEEENVRDKDVEPGSKRYQRTRSLEEAVDIPRAKRLSRDQGLVETSAVAQELHDFEAVYVMDSVGEMPTTFKTAMESIDAVKWKEACD
uniref:Uncharacterized protein n=1 Tax=Peronospora matthiolae TaxID=2874970 RepID=A0AAV1V0P5_9STRA